MAFVIKDEDGNVTKMGGKFDEAKPQRDEDLTDYSEYKSMPPAPSEKYEGR